jgi:hypothetical protein
MNEIELINKYEKEMVDNKITIDNSIDIEYKNLMKSHHIHKYFEEKRKSSEILINHDIVEYDNKKYVVCKINYKKDIKLFVVDHEDFDKIKSIDWQCTESGYIYIRIFSKFFGSVTIFLHMLIVNKLVFTEHDKKRHLSIDHKDRIRSDDRKENLRIATPAEQIINRTRLQRTVKLPDDCGITNEDLSRCLIYRKKPSKNHGSCFTVKLFNFNGEDTIWKSSSNKTLSLRFKLEHAKKYLRHVKEKHPDEFYERRIEKDYTDLDIKLIDGYNKIIELSKFSKDHIKVTYNNDKNYITEDLTGLTEEEKKILNDCNFDGEYKKKNLKNSLPKDCGVTIDMLPMFCGFRKLRNKEGEHQLGEHFEIKKHPITKKRIYWTSQYDMKVSVKEKYDQMIKKYNELSQEKQ